MTKFVDVITVSFVERHVLIIFVFVLVMPTLIPLMSNDVIHGLHDHHRAHHGQAHSQKTNHSEYHSAHFDITTYYSDYLHVDLKSPVQTVLKAPSRDNVIQQCLIVVPMDLPTINDGLLNNQTRAPPDIMAYAHDALPIYLSTQRFRI